MKLTIKTTSELKLPLGRKDAVFWDDDIAGFGIRLREGGTRTWIYRYRRGEQQRSLTLGSAKSVALATARQNASALEAEVRLGGDPALKKHLANLAAADTFESLASQYLEARRPKWRPKTAVSFTRHLLKYSKPLHHLPMTAVSQRDVAKLLTSITTTSGEPTANRVRSTLCALFSWALKEGFALPQGNIPTYTNKHAEKSRDRVLTDTELKTIWGACRDDDFGAIIKLLILTGCREAEIGGLRWSEVHHDEIVLPDNRTKNKREHTVPLSDAANTILDKFRNDNRTHVFGVVDTGFTGWGYAKRQLDDRLGNTVAHWTIHDLRRTVVTGMAERGIQPHIIEAVVNHVSGHKGGIAGVYNRASYDKEKRAALNLWAEHVIALVEGRKAVVVPMKKSRN
jgi:integrase